MTRSATRPETVAVVGSDFGHELPWEDIEATGLIASAPIDGLDRALETRALLTVVVNGPFTGVEGQPLNNGNNVEVATFNASDVAGTLADFSATISWGDGNTSAGIIVPGGASNTYEVLGTHTYIEETPPQAPDLVSVTVSGKDHTSATAPIPGTAVIADAPLTSSGVNLSESKGATFTAVVANFHDANPERFPAAEYSAQIDWGDNTAPSIGDIASDGQGGYLVFGTHAYSTGGSFTTKITIADTDGGSSTIALGTVSVSATALAPISQLIVATTGVPIDSTKVIAGSFVDNLYTPGPGVPVPSFQAAIDWGDGHTSLGTVTQFGTTNQFNVMGTNTYATPKTYPVNITVQDQSGHSTVIKSTAIVTGPTITAAGTTFPVTPGVPFANVAVATFTDTNPAALTTKPTVLIAWGDGHISPGLVSGPDANGVFTVTGSYTYLTTPVGGSFPVTVTIVDPSGQSGTASGKAVVVNTTTIRAFGTTFAAIPGTVFSGTVATFTDTSPAAATSQPTAVIAWGDGSTTAGTVSGPDANGLFTVTGSYNYLNPGPGGKYAVSVTITDSSGQQGIANSTADVSVGSILSATFTGGLATGGTFSGTNQPTFSGVANPFALVWLSARPLGVDVTLPLGQTIAGADGRWSLPTGPLAEGIYTVTAIVTPPGSSPSSPFLVGTNGELIIDTTPPRVVGISSSAGHDRIYVSFRDDLSGMALSSLTNVMNFTLSGPGLPKVHPISASLLPSGGLPTDTQQVVLTLGGTSKFRRRLRDLRITAAGITDNAGNALASNSHSLLPLTSGRAVANVVVKLDTHGAREPRR